MEINNQHIFFENMVEPFRVLRGCMATADHSFPAHWHNGIEILYFVEGYCDVRTNASHNRAQAGDLVCVNSGMVHFFMAPQNAVYNGVIISPSFLEAHKFPLHQQIESLIQSEEASAVFRRLVQESRSGDPYRQSAMEAELLSLLVMLYRRYAVTESAVEKKPMDKQIDMVQKIIRYINAHYSEDFTLKDISDATRFSTNYLCSTFRQVTGIPMRKYINDIRCRAAQTILTKGKNSVMEAAMSCGFDNLSYFTKTYKSIIGETPSETKSKSEIP